MEQETFVKYSPFWEYNPYHTMLRKNLRDHSVSVSPANVLPPVVAAPDILHLHSHQGPLRVRSRRVAESRTVTFINRLEGLSAGGTSIVTTLHDLRTHEGFHPDLDEELTGKILEISHALIFHSEFTLNKCLDTYGDSWRDKATIIPHPSYEGSYPETISRNRIRKKLGIGRKSTAFLLFGALRGNKGLLKIIETFQNWNTDSDSRLLLVGCEFPTMPGTALEMAQVRDKRIIYRPGFVPEIEVASYFAAADCVVFPYEEIATSGVLVLAMSKKRAVLAPEKWYFKDLLDNKGSVLYDPEDKNGLRSALSEVIDRKNELTAMGNHNYSLTHPWSPPLVAEKTWEVYDRLVRERDVHPKKESGMQL